MSNITKQKKLSKKPFQGLPSGLAFGGALPEVENVAEDIALRHGCRLYLVEFHGGSRGRVLRVYVDKATEGGATLDDCATISRDLNNFLDEKDYIPGGAYHLEVSTPGIERPLKKPWHYAESVGKNVQIRLSEPVGNFGVSIRGPVVAADELSVSLNIDGENIQIPFLSIEKAHVLFNFKE